MAKAVFYGPVLSPLVKNIPSISLHWTDLQVDLLSRRMAAIGADLLHIEAKIKKRPTFCEPFLFRGDYRSRTGDLLHAMQTL